MLSVIALLFIFRYTEYIFTALILTALIIWQIISLVRYVERTNRKLAVFLDSIRHGDFSSSFSDHGLGSSFDELNTAFNEVISEFYKTRKTKEEHFNYLQTIVQHISIAIMVYKKDGSVHMFNKAFQRLFGISNLRYIDELVRVDEKLSNVLQHVKSGESELVKVFRNDQLLQLSIRATEFRLRGEDQMLVSFQNIHNELEAKEMDSWQKLIRVLTHEIMNSITPIVSLSSTVKGLLIDEENMNLKKEIDPDDIESAQNALDTIERRSRGLLNFVQVYRNLTRIPKPGFRYFEVQTLFNNIEQLLLPKFETGNIECVFKVIPKKLMLTADPDLIEQVLINLIINATHAVQGKEKPRIEVLAAEENINHVIMTITDNGHGIKPDNLEQIFVPFFTSKKEGSGIGLSLSREIMRLHKGSITVKSRPGIETTFKLHF